METRCAFSIIIPVLHEETTINALLETLFRQCQGEAVEIIVVDGDPAKSTLQQIRSAEVITLSSEPGRGNQMNTGARAAHGDMLIFLHADTVLPPGAFAYIRDVLSQSEYVAGAFKLGLDSDRWIFRVIEIAASWRYRVTHIPYGDQAFFLPRDYFLQIGGFQDIPIMEDLELMRRIKRRNDRIHISTAKAVKTSVRRWEKEGILYAVCRTWLLASLYCVGVSPSTLVKYYRNA
ncbi:glycosyltransferase [candidate division KSB3 bacterium]|uniref:Glycosyltransferase n=1 Tax=candidate division KSB3 bacterium TaxID=2044937 RepID=A0A9D5JUU2_9BACT|nr:glycosyltransferase [candidate division KSB3 bacterium]MBD3324543.1 glycosyltransferase [candidate division KSB3 bacterium]